MKTPYINPVFQLLLLVAVFLLSGCRKEVDYDRDLSERLQILDTLVADRSYYLSEKEKRISACKSELSDSEGKKRYNVLSELCKEYVNYNLDSAAFYSREKIACAEILGDRKRMAFSRLELAKVTTAMGNDLETFRNIEMVLPDTADPGIRLKYYDVMASYADRQGDDVVGWYRKILPLLESDSADSFFTKANISRYTGDYGKAVTYIDSLIRHDSGNLHTIAIAQFIKGETFLQQNDTLAAIRCFVESSINDLKTPVRDYRSVYRLANLLLKWGDTDRAYDYITLAAEDVHATAVRVNVEAVGKILPDILHEYEKTRESEIRNQLVFTLGIASLTVLLAIALVVVALSRKQLSYVIVSEKKLNSRLKEANAALESMNEKLKEANHIRVSYLMQYVDLCSYYILCLDKFRMNVSTALKTKGTKGVETILAEADDDKELRRFYDSFDKTFLKLFPDFIDEFNRLVEPSGRVALSKDGIMTNELRTFALIRLGITDSVKISQFLRRSVSTVYNYRVKMRNAAVVDRDDFEKKVMEIGA